MVSKQDKSLIRRSFESERMNLEAFVSSFYAQFFAACPDVRALFPDDLAQQEIKLLASLTHIAEALDESERLDTLLQEQGEKHRRREVSDAHFKGFISSFTGALAETLGPDWNTETQQAWTRFLSYIATKMSFLTRD
ncbi:MAG: globin domain-containing protein [Leisingera sp.]